MTELFDRVFASFWTFAGSFAFAYLFLFFVVNGVANICNRFIRMVNIWRRGWPPEHLDADGDTHHKPTPKKP